MDADDEATHKPVVSEYTVRFEATDHDELGPFIATTVAELTGRPPAAVGDELADIVDPDVLDRLFVQPAAGDRSSGQRLELLVAGCRVTVAPDGTVTVTPDGDG